MESGCCMPQIWLKGLKAESNHRHIWKTKENQNNGEENQISPSPQGCVYNAFLDFLSGA